MKLGQNMWRGKRRNCTKFEGSDCVDVFSVSSILFEALVLVLLCLTGPW